MTREIKQLKRNFLAHQKKALQSAKPEVILSGAFGSGKTWTLCNKIVFLLLKS
jgi:tRNA A37 threonylcarbamoyladenosine biosynthesis protein TsaE